MDSMRLMQKWSNRRGWDQRTQTVLLYEFLDECGMETLGLLDRFLAGTAAGEDAAQDDGDDEA
jgi:hypothetical protein